MTIGKVCCARAAGRYERDGVCPITSGSARVYMSWRARNCPFLEIAADVLILNDNSFSFKKQRQKDVNVVVISG
jgi:hypothetical protein